MTTTSDDIERIDALLPQTQCRQCSYAGCRPYAEAIVAGRADINQCPPGGDDGARELARAMGVPPQPVDPRFGACKPPALAVIDEAVCIGCTLCIQACPVDAIVGAVRLMHTVIARDCTGCELCVAPCPVDCIHMVPGQAYPERAARRSAAERARLRYERREARLSAQQAAALAAASPDAIAKQRAVQRALERARQRLARRPRAGGA